MPSGAGSTSRGGGGEPGNLNTVKFVTTPTYEVANADSNCMLVFTDPACVITLPKEGLGGCAVWLFDAGGGATFITDSPTPIVNRQGHVASAGAGAEMSVAVTDNVGGVSATWWLAGDTA